MTGPARFRRPPRQKGAVLLILFLVLGIAAAALLVGTLTRKGAQMAGDEHTATALATTKDALIGYALRGDDGSSPNRPGSLPCPDTNNDGVAEASCSDGAIGRVPWKTLKIAEPLDGSGTPLWYALSGSFRPNSGTINSDSKGTLQVRNADGTTLLTPAGSEAVAILFAPGAALGGQSRGTAAEQTTASNYLEAVGPIDNATGAPIAGNCSVTNQGGTPLANCPTFIAGTPSATFNDQLLVIAAKDFMPAIEKRVAKVMESALSSYYTSCGFYPRPADFANTACLPGGNVNNCLPSTSLLQGRFPYNARPNFTDPNITVDWVGLPNWFLANRWDRVAYYAVGSGFVLAAASQTCPGNCLTVDTNNAVRRLIFMPGTPMGNANSRPSTLLGEYLEDPENTNLNTVFVTPTSIANDLLFQLPRTGKTADASTYSPSNSNPACSGTASSPSTDLGGAILDTLGLSSPPPGGNTGQSSITLANGIVISTLGFGNITVTSNGVGSSALYSPGLSIGETLDFAFPSSQNSLAIYVNKLNKNDAAMLVFYNGIVPVGSTFINGCANGATAFNNISLPGNPSFTHVTVTSLSIGGLYILGIQSCTGGGGCSITSSGATSCPWP